MDPLLYVQLIFDKAGKNVQQNKKDSLSNKWCWGNWMETYRGMKLDHFLTPYRKINSKWMRNLNVRQVTIKILQKNTANNLLTLAIATSY